MNTILSFTFLLVTSVSFSQCYNCNYDRSDQKSTHGPKRTFKKDFPGIKKVKWYSCDDEINYGVRDYADSTITYIYSKEKAFLGKETRYFKHVVKHLEESEQGETSLVKCISPNILPKTLWPDVATIYQVENLDTLNQVDGMPFWVCDIYKVEVPKTHIMAQKEGTTTFYLVNMDFQYHIFKETEELNHLMFMVEYHPQFYLETEDYFYNE
ncbi:MAG: hypothetical protein ACJASQ_000095 [Crocinitomicaceae bacterium]|jgi:hypothetical protein